MAATFNESQKIDYLWKKVGYGVTKTAEETTKQAFNESIPSPLLYRGDLIWMESNQIPSTSPAATSSIVQVYQDGVGSFSPSVECTEDLTSPDNQTWKTNLTNWVPTQFGSSYLVQVYVANTGVTNPQTSGTKLFQAGSGTDDTWFFDYQSGVLNFNGTNIPAQITGGVTGKSIYIVGYRYVGLIGVTNQPSGNISGNTNIGNLNFTNTTISTITTNSNIYLTPNGTGNLHVTTSLTASGNIVANTGAFYIGDGGFLGNLNTSGVSNGNSNVSIPSSNGNVNISAVGNTTLVVAGNGVNVFGYLTVTGTLIAGNINSNVSSNTVTANSANISGNLYVADTATIGNVRTDHILYANGQPWDLQEAAGANTQIQYNDGNTNFGASANFTFDQTTNLLTVIGNINTTNANLGNLVTANYVNVSSILNGNVGNFSGNLTSLNANLGNLVIANFYKGAFDNTSSNQSNITTVGNLTFLNVDGVANLANALNVQGVANLANTLSVQGVANLANVLNVNGNINANSNIIANANITGANLNTLGLANIGNLEISGKVTGNLIPTIDADGLGNGYNLGTATYRWKDLFLSGNSVYLGEQSITSNASGITLANTTFVTDLQVSNNATINLALTGNTANFSGNVIMPNATVNLELTGNTANFSGNIVALNTNAGNLLLANVANFAVNLVTNNATVNLELTGNTANFSGNVVALNTNAGNLLLANVANISGNLITNNSTINLQLQANTANFSGNVQMDKWLTVADTANVGNLRTDHILYANGVPWDLQEAAGANTEIQYNDGVGNFGASANFTFNYATNLLTVTGNANIASNLYVADTALIGNVRTDHILYANGQPWDLQEAAGSNTQIQFNDGNTNFGASANFTFNQATNLLDVVGNANIASNLYVADTALLGNMRTDHLLYANGSPWDLQEAAGLVTYIQYNADNGDFGASANFTYNDTTQLFTIAGNISASNASLGNLASANYINVLANLSVADTANVGVLRTNYLLYANGQPWDLQEAAGSNTQIQYNDGNTNFGASANFTFNPATNLLNVIGNANVTNFNASGTINAIGNISAGNANLGNLTTSNYFHGIFDNTSSSQPNITSVGNLTNLTIGNATSNVVIVNGNITATGNINANNMNGNFTGTFTGNVIGNITGIGSNTQVLFNYDGDVNGSNAFVFDYAANILILTGTGNITGNLNVSSNVTAANGVFGNISTTGVAGDITGANLISTVTLTASGNITSANANLGNTAIANNVIANTFQMGVGVNEFYHSTVYFATTIATTPNQVLWSTSIANLSAIDFTIISTDETSNTRQTAKIAAAVLGTEVVFNEYSGLYINGGVGSFSVNYQAGSPDTVKLVVTPDSSNLTKYNMMIIQYAK